MTTVDLTFGAFEEINEMNSTFNHFGRLGIEMFSTGAVKINF